MSRPKWGILAVVALGLALIAAPARAADVTATYVQGPFAEATFTTAPPDGALVPGQVYRTVFVTGAAQASTDSAGVTVPFAFVDVYTFTVDEQGMEVLISDTFGGGSPPDAAVTFTVDHRLSQAHVQATVQLKTITPDNPGGGPGGTGTFDVAWSGSGRTVHWSDLNRTMVPGQFVYLAHDHGTARDAAASGTVLGVEYSGTGTIGTDRFRERLVTR